MRARRRCLLAAIATTAFITGACTGDGDVEVLVDEGADPSALLGEAIDNTLTRSGRIVQVTSIGAPELSEQSSAPGVVENLMSSMELRLEGEFDGSDFRVDMTADSELGPEHGTWLAVGGDQYRTVDPVADRMALDALDGRTWIEVPEWLSATDPAVLGHDGEVDPIAGVETPGDVTGALESLRDLVELAELDPGEIDGEEYRRLGGRHASVPGLPVGVFGASLDDDERARWELVDAYRAERMWVRAEVWIDDAGLIRRLVMDSVDEVESQYRECILLQPWPTRTQLDLIDLGAKVDITAPDPDDVMPAEEDEQLTGFDRAAWDDLSEWDGDGSAPLPDGYFGDEATTTTALGEGWTDDGPALDDELVDDLIDDGLMYVDPGSVEWDHDPFEGCPA